MINKESVRQPASEATGPQTSPERAGVEWVNLMLISDHGTSSHRSNFRIELDTPMAKTEWTKLEQYLAAGNFDEAAAHLKAVRSDHHLPEHGEFIEKAFAAGRKWLEKEVKASPHKAEG
jgi:hypothetical protein